MVQYVKMNHFNILVHTFPFKQFGACLMASPPSQEPWSLLTISSPNLTICAWTSIVAWRPQPQAMCTKEWLQEGLIKWNWVAQRSKHSFCCLVIFYVYKPFINCLYPLFTVSVYLQVFCKHNLNSWSPTCAGVCGLYEMGKVDGSKTRHP